MYYLPVRHFVRDTFTQADLVPHLSNETVEAEPGSLKASRGWAEKITNNPLMHGRRDLAFVGMSDGVPYFKDKTKRSGTAAFLRHGSLPEAMALQNRNCHLAALQPSVYLSWCPKKKKAVKVHKNPKNQTPLMTVLCDELYDLNVRGVEVTDYSMPEGAPGRVFVCRCCLLFWYVSTEIRFQHPLSASAFSIRFAKPCFRRIGDYPGQGEVSGMAHQGSKACHWCEGCWPKSRAYRRCCFDGHERWLDAGNPLRTGDDLAPADRTPASVARDAKASEDTMLPWQDQEHPRRKSGVNGVSPCRCSRCSTSSGTSCRTGCISSRI
jgi:hypothetical protein